MAPHTPGGADEVLAPSSHTARVLARSCPHLDKAFALRPGSVGWLVSRAITNYLRYELACMWTPHAELPCDPFRLTEAYTVNILSCACTSEHTPAVVVSTTLHGDGSGLQLCLIPISCPLTIGPLGPDMFAACMPAYTAANISQWSCAPQLRTFFRALLVLRLRTSCSAESVCGVLIQPSADSDGEPYTESFAARTLAYTPANVIERSCAPSVRKFSRVLPVQRLRVPGSADSVCGVLTQPSA